MPVTEAALALLSQQVLWGAFFLALCLGAVAQRSHFCTMGALADVVNMGSTVRLRQWVAAMGVAVWGFHALVAWAGLQPADTLYTGSRLPWLSLLLGGLLFGVGMVLASGCGQKTLVRLGGGNLKSLVVLLAMAFGALMALRGVLAVPRVQLLDTVALQLPVSQRLPALLASVTGGSVPAWHAALGLGVGALLCAWAWAPREGRTGGAFWPGAGVGLLVVALWWLTGVYAHLAEHPDTLAPAYVASSRGLAESFSFVSPVAQAFDWLTYFSDSSKTLGVGIVMVPGVVLGSALTAWRSGQFRWEGFRTTEDLVFHTLGGLLMGVGGVLALGCTFGQGLSGVSTLSLGSLVAVAGLVLGGVAALRWQAWRLERMA